MGHLSTTLRAFIRYLWLGIWRGEKVILKQSGWKSLFVQVQQLHSKCLKVVISPLIPLPGFQILKYKCSIKLEHTAFWEWKKSGSWIFYTYSHLSWQCFYQEEMGTKAAVIRSIDCSAENIFHQSLKLYCQARKANRASFLVDCSYKNERCYRPWIFRKPTSVFSKYFSLGTHPLKIQWQVCLLCEIYNWAHMFKCKNFASNLRDNFLIF